MNMKKIASVLLRIILCLLIFAGGFIGMKKLKSMKKPPEKAERKERALAVQVIRIQEEKAPVIISGYGEIISRSIVTLPAEVSGRITSVHKDLQVGAIIKKGEVLYRINEQDFRLNLETAQASLKSLSRDIELARKEYKRVSKLYQKNKVGTQSSVEKGERSVNAIISQIIQVEQSIAQAKLQLARCVIRAPFTGRVTELHADLDEYVTPGKNLLTLTDDSDLEVRVSLDSRDARDWLRFKPRKQNLSWFALPEKTACTVTWTENAATKAKGRLDRVVRFNPRTRSLIVAIRMRSDKAVAFPLVQGMFCRVDIEGRSLDKVFLLPRSAVSFERTVYVVKDNRLRTRKVEMVRAEDSTAFITGGLEEGEQVIITRLENPLENALVKIVNADQETDDNMAVEK
ncbi:MAG: efflux RND transporter periplasmic adaptor subunit [Candidatus Electrothrix sp. AR4]|nr:efflux RND transporter periplasmic adaptor subunit [Candidatus Electrothrix sp. AR4]